MSNTEGSVFITGGGSGLGEAAALHFAHAGYQVGIAGRSAARLQSVILKAGANLRDRVQCFPLDVRDADALDRAIQSFLPTALICCAAILGRGAASSDLTSDLFNEVQAINVGGSFNACRAAIRYWKAQGLPGDIVTISSLAGLRGQQRFAGFAAYAASKHAVIGLTEALAFEAKPFGIRVNAVAPGQMRTPQGCLLEPEPRTTPDKIVPTLAFLLDRTRSESLNGSTIEINCNED